MCWRGTTLFMGWVVSGDARTALAFITSTGGNFCRWKTSSFSQSVRPLKLAPQPLDVVTQSRMLVDDIHPHMEKTQAIHQSFNPAGSNEVANNHLRSFLSSTIATSDAAIDAVDAAFDLIDVMPEEQEKIDLAMDSWVVTSNLASYAPVAGVVAAVCDFAITKILRDDYEEAERQRVLEEQGEGAKQMAFLVSLAYRLGVVLMVTLLTVVVATFTFNPRDLLNQ